MRAVLLYIFIFGGIPCFADKFNPYDDELLRPIEINEKIDFEKEIFELQKRKKLGWIAPPKKEDGSYGDRDLETTELLGFLLNFGPSRPLNGQFNASCQVVEYAHNSTKYLYKRFHILREQALEILEILQSPKQGPSPLLERKYFEIVNEINEVFELVKNAYPPEFFEWDRQVTYEYSMGPDWSFDSQTTYQYNSLIAINFGQAEWIETPDWHIEYFDGFDEKPIINNAKGIVSLTRKLTPSQACLDRLEVELKMVVLKSVQRGGRDCPAVLCSGLEANRSGRKGLSSSTPKFNGGPGGGWCGTPPDIRLPGITLNQPLKPIDLSHLELLRDCCHNRDIVHEKTTLSLLWKK